MKWFNRQSRLLQVILLLIPGVNWITEIIVRLTGLFQKPSLRNLLGFILAVLVGFAFGWVDLIWVLLFNHLILCK